MLEPKVVKDYFKKEKTVSQWWEPDKSPQKHRALYMSEMMDVLKILSSVEEKHILDVGTGKGRFAIELAKRGAKVTAVDISEEMLAIASKRALEQKMSRTIIFEVGDAEDIKFPANFFDHVICIQTLMHIPNPLKCLKELARVAKQNGLVVVDHENKDRRWRIIIKGKKNYLEMMLKDIYLSGLGLPLRCLLHVTLKRPLNPSVMSGITRDELIDLVKRASLKIEHVINYGPGYCPAYFMIVARKCIK